MRIGRSQVRGFKITVDHCGGEALGTGAKPRSNTHILDFEYLNHPLEVDWEYLTILVCSNTQYFDTSIWILSWSKTKRGTTTSISILLSIWPYTQKPNGTLVATISASNKYSAANTKGLTAAFLSVAKLPSDLSLFPSISNSNSKSTSVYLSCLHFPGDPDALWHPLHGSIILIFNMAVMAPYISIDPERGLRSTRVKMNKASDPRVLDSKGRTDLYLGTKSQTRFRSWGVEAAKVHLKKRARPLWTSHLG